MDKAEQMLTSASMYYLQDVKMDVIAAHLHLSRSTVSRHLKEARESGLVEITLRPVPSAATALGDAINETFGVTAHIVPVRDSSTPAERLDLVAMTAARLLATWFDSGMILGVAWGTTIAAVSRHVPTKPTRASAVVQLNGSANTRTSGVEFAAELMVRFGTAFDAQLHAFPVPAFFDYAATRDAMWRERSVARVIELQRRADIALFGVGALGAGAASHVYTAGYLDAADLRSLEKEGVVGDVCTVFLRADGTHADLGLNLRATGPTPRELTRIPRRVCVVAGEAKAVPLLAALRAGTATDLVIDESTARAVVDLVRASEPGESERPSPG